MPGKGAGAAEGVVAPPGLRAVPVLVPVPPQQHRHRRPVRGRRKPRRIDAMHRHRNRHLVILPRRHIAQRHDPVVARLHRAQALRTDRPAPVDHLRDLLHVASAAPVHRVGQRPTLAAAVVDADRRRGAVAQCIGGRDDHRVGSGVEFRVVDLHVEVARLLEPSQVRAFRERAGRSAVEREGECLEAVGVGGIAQQVDPLLGDAGRAEALRVAVPERDARTAAGIDGNGSGRRGRRGAVVVGDGERDAVRPRRRVAV